MSFNKSKKYSIENSAEEYIKIYEKTLKNGGK